MAASLRDVFFTQRDNLFNPAIYFLNLSLILLSRALLNIKRFLGNNNCSFLKTSHTDEFISRTELAVSIVELYRSFLNCLVFLHFKSDKTLLDRSITS